ncbi:M56 family metallopeptidase [Galbibacter mesophilus]|uniref:M56 family metallopeptidase n=1 Tax=Galbibacter mesophilus TaxID=379069 RepID=UPI00191F729C|nr:M56 family metallopeptidase [Galbibacter mesophilus]MCM5662259.1 M56 family metallopeptidase [Galbibacter mesophilus]
MSYIIQTITFQLIFLVIYDLFLKKETFFNWNRMYLIATPMLSFLLPFIKIEQFKSTVSEDSIFLLPEVVVGNSSETIESNTVNFISSIAVWEWVLIAGSFISVCWFLYKLIQLHQLKNQGDIHYFQRYRRVSVDREVAFSFFNTIFIGKKILQKPHDHIIEHELVHIKEKHTWDLLFFEVIRIVFWFNPLIYIYQSRITELHEFIADAKTVKNNKKEHYNRLLEEVFKTERISFVNQFFNHSLIKKRIVMLQKSKSKKVWQLKYLLLFPLVLGMLFYTSCEKEETTVVENQKMSLEEQIQQLETTLASESEAISPDLRKRIFSLSVKASKGKFTSKGEFDANKLDQGADVPFTVIPQKPMFTDCDGVAQENQFDCFKEKLDSHVRATFKYPEEAKANGEQGRVYINFRINTDGSVTVLNTRAPAASLDAEGKRIIEALPTLIPGKDQNGNLHPVTFAYPIVFKLGDDK